MVRAVLFDMDGLMIDSEPLQSLAFEAVIREYGKEPLLYDNGLVHEIGVRGDKNWLALMEKYDISEDITVLRSKRRAVYEQLVTQVEAMPGLHELLGLLKKNNVLAAVVTSSPRKHAEPILANLNISDHFTHIICGDEVEKGKPDPEGFLRASQLLEIHPQHCLVIEDAESGLRAAKLASMNTIAVPSKYTKHHDLQHADLVVESLHDISWDVIRSF